MSHGVLVRFTCAKVTEADLRACYAAQHGDHIVLSCWDLLMREGLAGRTDARSAASQLYWSLLPDEPTLRPGL